MTEAFFDYLTYEKKLSKHTIEAYKSDLKQLECFCEKINDNLLSLNTKVLRQWVVFLLENNNSNSSVNRKLSSVKSFYKFAEREKMISHNPSKNLILPRKNKRLPSFLKEDEMGNLFNFDFFDNNVFGQRDKLILELLYLTGIRRDELINIESSDVDFYRKSLLIKGKGNKTRILPIPNWLVTELSEYLLGLQKMQYSTSYLFVTNRGAKLYPNFVYRLVKKYLSLITTQQKRSPHVLRHTFATHMLNEGAELNAIKELLGHASLAATQVYTHNSFQKLKKTYNQAHPRA